MNWDQLRSNSYTPYSQKPEFCVIKSRRSVIYPGVRIENSSYPLTITAEQAAVSSCLSEGDTPEKLIYPESVNRDSCFWQKEFRLELEFSDRFPEGDLFKAVVRPEIPLNVHLSHLKDRAVTPNSAFPVASLLKVGEGYTEGVNVEFSSWSSGLCAERVAICKALAAGCRNFHSLILYIPGSDFASPCGGCRQVISEWMYRQPVELHHGNGTVSIFYAKDLLPYAIHTAGLNSKRMNQGLRT